MPALNKFNSFIERVFEGAINCQTDSFKVALSNTLPVAANSDLADITQIANGNGYVTGGNSAGVTSSGQTGGVYRLVIADVAFVATGAIGPFQYVVLYDDTHASDALVGWADFGAPQNLVNGQVFVIDFDQTLGAIEAS
jgi:hypothetical protein